MLEVYTALRQQRKFIGDKSITSHCKEPCLSQEVPELLRARDQGRTLEALHMYTCCRAFPLRTTFS